MKYLLHIDGKLPNLALMRLSTYFRERGERVRLVRGTGGPELFDEPGEAFGSSIFDFSAKARAAADKAWSGWGGVHWGGTGVRVSSSLAEIDPSVDWDAIAPDYSLYPDFAASMGFNFRGCRSRCKFCVVPEKEGDPRPAQSILDIYRGEPHPRWLHLLDNDFFGGPDWRDSIEAIRDGGFAVAFSQGINIRQITAEAAWALSTINYRDNSFGKKILYTAWDSLGDEKRFKVGVDTLARAGVPAKHLRVYMLMGYAPGETFEAVKYRFDEMLALGCEPYPMLYKPDRTDDYGVILRHFQRYAIRRIYRKVPWEKYRTVDQRGTKAALRDGRLPMFEGG